ncbi:MAG: flagellar basal body rod C-terminal domain-containing protein, partial [Oleibacter sp.]|nr:flagellar basal body rod C-terminal domain-containing protein [Thalassolituus sp.]
AESIAELNEQIQFASAGARGDKPNELLDQRDKLLKDLSEFVEVTTVTQDDNAVNVLIGNGQALVIGNEFNRLYADNGASDPSRADLYFTKGTQIQNVTAQLTGGQLGGILEFREEVLDPAINNLGRLSLVIAQTMNDQHRLGIDYDGIVGGEFFEDINGPDRVYQRVSGSRNNAQPDDRLISVYIDDASALSTSDYEIHFPGPDNNSYRVTRISDNKILETDALSGSFPESIFIEGMEIRFESGSFQKGDRFAIRPTRNESAELNVFVTRGEQIALASPISTDAAIGNRGSASIDQGEVYDLNSDYFSDNDMAPPIIIRFTSPTSYDVLDNTDPGNPIPLFPPLMNQKFVPGIANNMLPENEGKLGFTSFGGVLATAPTYQASAPAAVVDAVNGFFPERINISFTNPSTGQSVTQKTLLTPENASAREIAQLISERQGVSATARTTMQISDLSQDPNGFMPMEISINGIKLTDVLGSNQNKYESGYPAEVPSPLDLNFIADRINANFDLQEKGIVARSDGAKLTVIALNGDDIDLEVKGDLEDSVKVSSGEVIALTEADVSPDELLNEFEGYDFSESGPYIYEFEVPGQGNFAIEMTGKYATGDDLLAGFRQKLESSGMVFSGDLDITINERGQVSFQSRLELSGTGPNGSNKIAMGGQIKIEVDQNYSISIAPPGNNLFDAEPVGSPVHFGFQVSVDGVAQSGDEFTVQFNKDGTSDSRNGSAMADLQSRDTVGTNTSYSESYARLVEKVGSVTSRAQINRDSSETLLRNSQSSVDSTSGVNLDEEAAALIKYELAYNASAQVISVARQIFETLIATFR